MIMLPGICIPLQSRQLEIAICLGEVVSLQFSLWSLNMLCRDIVVIHQGQVPYVGQWLETNRLFTLQCSVDTWGHPSLPGVYLCCALTFLIILMFPVLYGR